MQFLRSKKELGILEALVPELLPSIQSFGGCNPYNYERFVKRWNKMNTLQMVLGINVKSWDSSVNALTRLRTE
jgi:hypothetical protein